MKKYNKFYLYEHYASGFNGYYTDNGEFYYDYDVGNFTFYNANYDNISVLITDWLLHDADNQESCVDITDSQLSDDIDILSKYSDDQYVYDSKKIINKYANGSWDQYANQTLELQEWDHVYCCECSSEIFEVEGGFMCNCETELTYQQQYEIELMQLWRNYFNQMNEFNKHSLLIAINRELKELTSRVNWPSNELMELYYQVTGQQNKLKSLNS